MTVESGSEFFHAADMREKHRETEVPEEKSPSGRMSRWPCKDYLQGTCNNLFCEKWHPPECLFYKSKSGCGFGEKCSYAHRQVDEQPSKRSKKNDDKSAVAMLKSMSCMIERGNPLSTVTPVTSQITDLLGAVHRIRDNWVSSFRTWSRSLSYGSFVRAEFVRMTYWSQTLRSWRRWTHRKSTRKDSMRWR